MPKENADRHERSTGAGKRRTSAPPHYTLETIDKATGKVLDRMERYGIHEAHHLSEGPNESGTPECIVVFEDLRCAAINLLKQAGEGVPFKLLETIEKESGDVRAMMEALHKWSEDISGRYSSLSPLSMAARFFMIGYGVRGVLVQPTAESTEHNPDGRENDLERKMMVVAEFAHVWHRWHMEVFGEHAAAYGGLTRLVKANQSRQVGKESRERHLARYLEGRENISASKIADQLKTVNAYLSEKGLRSFPSTGALKKAVERLRQKAKSGKR